MLRFVKFSALLRTIHPIATSVNNPIRWCTSNVKNTPSEAQLINDVIVNNEKVAFYGRKAVERVFKTFLSAGFTPENGITIISTNPNILSYTSKQLDDKFEMWHMCQFSKTQFYELMVQCPELLEFDDPHQFAKRYGQLRGIARTPKNIWRLLMACPNVIVDDMKTINEKVDYVLDTMEADVTDLVKSGTLALPIKTIKSRHMLLVRLGIYKKKDGKASELDPNKNPRLFRIMDCDDEEFAKKTCEISVKEVEAFYDLYERELEEKKAEINDYGEDSDLETDDETQEEFTFDAREEADQYDDRHRNRYKKHLHIRKSKNHDH